MPEQNTTEFGNLVDGTSEGFKEHCADKDLGYVLSLRNHIIGAYQTLLKMREDLLKKIKEEKLTDDSEEMTTLKGIYVELMKLEEKACLCWEIIKERELKD